MKSQKAQPKPVAAKKAVKKTSPKKVKAAQTKQRRTMATSADLRHSLSLSDAFVPETQRTYRNWQNKPVSPDVIKKAFDTIKYGPTAFNSSPLRVGIVQTKEAKAKLAKSLMAGNVGPMEGAPLTAVLAWDSAFHDHFDFLSPGYDGPKKHLDANPDQVKPTAELNSHLQAGYLIAALRTQGLDLGPASGFDPVKCDEELFAGNDKTKSWKSFMYINIGHANPEGIFPRSPRFDFDTVSQQI